MCIKEKIFGYYGAFRRQAVTLTREEYIYPERQNLFFQVNDNYLGRGKWLEALFETKVILTLLFTYSVANNQWLGFHHIGMHPLGEDLDGKSQEKEQQNFLREHPHIINSLFYDRVKFMLENCFGLRGIKKYYPWHKIKYQERSTAYSRGCLWLESYPGIVVLNHQVLQGRQSQRNLYLQDNHDDYCS